MSYSAQYVSLSDDKTDHIIGDGQRTRCGEAIPYGSPWDTEEPEFRTNKVCSKCRKAQDGDKA